MPTKSSKQGRQSSAVSGWTTISCVRKVGGLQHRDLRFFALSSAPWCFEHCGIGRWLQTSFRWSVVLKSRIWSHPGGDKYSFVDDFCPQYLHCTDEDQQSETARLSTVGPQHTKIYTWSGWWMPFTRIQPTTRRILPYFIDYWWITCY